MMDRASHIYNYPLYSFKRFPIFIHFCKKAVTLLYNKGLISKKKNQPYWI